MSVRSNLLATSSLIVTLSVLLSVPASAQTVEGVGSNGNSFAISVAGKQEIDVTPSFTSFSNNILAPAAQFSGSVTALGFIANEGVHVGPVSTDGTNDLGFYMSMQGTALSNQSLLFGTGSTPALALNASRATAKSSPTYSLQMNGGITSSGNVTANGLIVNEGLHIGPLNAQDNANASFTEGFYMSVNSQTQYLQIGSQVEAPAKQALVVTPNNNVGVNNPTPAYPLDVNGTVNATTEQTYSLQLRPISLQQCATAYVGLVHWNAAGYLEVCDGAKWHKLALAN